MVIQNHFKVVKLNIEQRIEGFLFEELLSKAGLEVQKKIRKFRHWQDAQRSLFGDLLVRAILIRSFGLQNNNIVYDRSRYDKPSIKGLPDLHFNMSHSGDWIVCTIDKYPVGIDVELIVDIDLSVSEKYFSPDEHNSIMNTPDKKAAFFEYWTLKESYLKFVGEGLNKPLNSFSVKFLDDYIGIEVNNKLIPEIYFKQYHLDSNYKMAVCATHQNFPQHPMAYTLTDIIKTMRCDNRG